MPTHDRIDELFQDGQLLDEGVQYAVRRAIWESKQLGYPISTWRDGKVVIIPADEIQIEKPVPNFPIPPKGSK